MSIFDPPPRPRFYAGLDLGQASEYTALAVLERNETAEGAAGSYAVRHLQRWPVGTNYADIVADLARRIAALAPSAVLAIDITGVGRAVLQEMARANLRCRCYTITIIQGQSVVAGPQGPCVPKKDLVSTLQVLLQARRLLVSNALPESNVLATELNTFSAKVRTTDDAAYDWRERPHDDLVLAVAVAAWVGENTIEPYAGPLVIRPPVPFGDLKKARETPKSRMQEIYDDLGFDPFSDW